MKYYLVFLKNGIVTDVTKHDVQSIRDSYAMKAEEMIDTIHEDDLGYNEVQAIDIVD